MLRSISITFDISLLLLSVWIDLITCTRFWAHCRKRFYTLLFFLQLFQKFVVWNFVFAFTFLMLNIQFFQDVGISFSISLLLSGFIILVNWIKNFFLCEILLFIVEYWKVLVNILQFISHLIYLWSILKSLFVLWSVRNLRFINRWHTQVLLSKNIFLSYYLLSFIN